MLKWAANLKHLQLILLDYNLIKALAKPTMLKYFQKDLKFFILAKLQNKDLELKSFVQIVKKVVIANAKANLQLWAITQDIDQQCPWGFWPATTTTAKTNSQGNSQNTS